MIINDILKVIYAPHKVFKEIAANPKYLGVIIILILFISLEVGYEYSQYSKTYTEQTTPKINQLSSFTNATIWTSSADVALSNDAADYFNYSVFVAGFALPPTDSRAYYNVFGNTTSDSLPSSLQMSAVNANNISVALGNAFNVDCSRTGFQNLSLSMKLVQPKSAPQTATLTMYSLGDVDFYQYDLTNQVSGTSAIDHWANLTIPLGPNATGWTTSGNPTWNNITALKLDFMYPSGSNITIHIGALFFRGQYLTPIQYNGTAVLLDFLQRFSFQFIIGWFILTGLIYLLCRLTKSSVLWKPLFISLGFALSVMVIRALVNLAATFTAPAVYYPFDISLGVTLDPFGALYYPPQALGALSTQSQAIFSSIDASTVAFRTIVAAMFLVSYAWLGALGAIIIKVLKPEFTTVKCIVFSAVSLAITILILLFLLLGSV